MERSGSGDIPQLSEEQIERLKINLYRDSTQERSPSLRAGAALALSILLLREEIGEGFERIANALENNKKG